MKGNQSYYDSPEVVQEYEHHSGLTPPEKTILGLIAADSKNGSMLDIGMGTGRTTRHFAAVFTSYFGIDYSGTMVAACRSRYGDLSNVRFENCDARDMQLFPDHSFDFVLFSFNGIDCVDSADRLIIFKEIRRIIKPGGKFAFSSHNIYNVNKLFSFQMPRNPLKYMAEYKRMKKVRELNPPAEEILKMDIAELIDGDIGFNARYVYIKPEMQLEQLKEMQFSGTRVFSLRSGKEIAQPAVWDRIQDAWLYYLCTA